MDNERLGEALRWLRQTVHQAHHEGAINECRKNTCAFIDVLLSDNELLELVDSLREIRRLAPADFESIANEIRFRMEFRV